jgi:hypothetical protein
MDKDFERWDLNHDTPKKRAGQLVETKSGLVGRTYNHEALVNGKVKVYTSKGNLLCDPSTLKLKGFID